MRLAIEFAYVLMLAILPSWIKVPYLRMMGAKIGRGSKISMFALVWADRISLGIDTKISPFSVIRCRSLCLGNRVQIKSTVVIDTVDVRVGHDSIVMEQVVVGGMKTSRSSLVIGERVKIFPYSFINPTEPIVIEDEVGVGGANYIFTHGSWQSALDGYPIAFGPVTIRRGVWLPWRVFILPNVEIGENCTVGANSVITKSVPPNCLVAGAPAKVISSDGGYLKRKTRDERLAYVDYIFDEMFDYFRFEGMNIEIDRSSDRLSATLNDRPRFSIEYFRGGIPIEGQADILVSFDDIPDAIISRLVEIKCSWIDIGRRQCFFGSSKQVHLVRAFFGRFGVRFSVWGETSVTFSNNRD